MKKLIAVSLLGYIESSNAKCKTKAKTYRDKDPFVKAKAPTHPT